MQRLRPGVAATLAMRAIRPWSRARPAPTTSTRIDAGYDDWCAAFAATLGLDGS